MISTEKFHDVVKSPVTSLCCINTNMVWPGTFVICIDKNTVLVLNSSLNLLVLIFMDGSSGTQVELKN